MDSDPIEIDEGSYATLFGPKRGLNRTGDPFVVPRERTAWEIYNLKTSKIDKELIKDWNDALYTLLIFVRYINVC
jgi:hypothetical protein